VKYHAVTKISNAEVTSIANAIKAARPGWGAAASAPAPTLHQRRIKVASNFRKGSAVLAVSDDCPLLIQLKASRCIAANSRLA